MSEQRLVVVGFDMYEAASVFNPGVLSSNVGWNYINIGGAGQELHHR